MRLTPPRFPSVSAPCMGLSRISRGGLFAIIGAGAALVIMLGAAQRVAAGPATGPGSFSQATAGAINGTSPDGTCRARVTGRGGAGASSGVGAPNGGIGAGGAVINATFDVLPLQTFSGGVGAGGTVPNGGAGIGGGTGGTGGTIASVHRGGGGGGRTNVVLGGVTVLVSGGGGGGGGTHNAPPAGNGGGGGFSGIAAGVVAPGVTAPNGVDGANTVTGGRGGSAAAGGAAGTNSGDSARNGFPGSGIGVGTGGTGGNDNGADSGGGGGGGYTGGGGGAATFNDTVSGAGGGGGSSFVVAGSPVAAGTAPTAVSGSGGPASGTGSVAGAAGLATIDWLPCLYDLAVTKTVSPDPVNAGAAATWTVAVTNNGPDPMTRGDTIDLTDTLPAGPNGAPAPAYRVTGFTVSGGTNANMARGAVTCTGVTVGQSMPASTTCSRPYNAPASPQAPSGGLRGLDPGETITITYEQIIANTAPCATITNTASVVDRPGQTGTTDIVGTTATDNVPRALTINCYDLAITKVASPKPVNQGDPITWTITVTNNGPGAMEGPAASGANPLIVSDTFPTTGVGAATLATSTGPAGACTLSGGTVTCPSGLPAAGVQTLTFTQPVDTTAVAGSTIANTATVTDPRTGDTNDSANDSTTVRPVADLAIVKTGPATVVQGAPISYTLVVRNNGPSNVTGAQIADTIPTNITGVTWTCVAAGTADCNTAAGGTGATGAGNLALGAAQINAGAANTLTITVSGTATTAGTFTNTATVAPPAGTIDNVTANNSSAVETTITPAADLAITKTGTATVVQGGTVNYAITVTNNGPSNVTGALIADAVPANLTGVSWTCASAGTAACGTASGSGNAISLLGNINAGAGNSVTITVTGTATTAGSFTNTATVSPPAGTTDPTPGNNSASQPTTVTPAADLAITKTGTATVNQNGTVTYAITVTNLGPSNVTGAQITDTVPANLTAVSWSCAAAGTAACGTASGSGNAISLLANINAGAGNSVSINVTGTATTPGSFTNTATVAPPAGTTDPVSTNNSSSQPTTITPTADLAIAKTGPATAVQGTTVNYAITVTNLGPSNVTGAQITDTVPASLTGVSWTCASAGTAACGTASGSGNAISLLANINAGAGNSVTISVTGTATTAGSFTNTATVAPPAGITDPVTGNNTSAVNTTITPSADLAIAKTGTVTVVQGGAVTYTITVTNNGPSNVTGATIADAVPANLTGVSWTCASAGTAACGTASGSGNAISLLGNINAGAGNSLTIAVNATATTPGSFTNTATVAPPAGTTDPVAGNNSASQPTTITPSADLAITKTGTATVVQGNTVTYTITVTNNGPSNVTGATIADTVPSNLTGVAWTCTSVGTATCGTASGSGNAISLLGNINAGAGNSITIQVTGTATTPGSFTNTATVAPPAGITDPVAGNNSASQPTTIGPAADLAITKTGTATVAQGGAVSYTVTVTNLGPSNVTGASISDIVPAAITGVTWTCASAGTAACGTASGSGNEIILSANINSGAGNSVTMTVTGTATTAGSFTNTATVDPPAGTIDPTPGNNSASQPTTITAAADLAIAKTGTATVAQGGAVNYTITVTNLGPSNVTGAQIADTVPAAITGVSWTCVSAGTAACGTASGSGNAISLLGNINAGAGNSLTITVSGTSSTVGSFTNTATVAPPVGTTDPVTGNNSASQPTTITPSGSLSIAKTGTTTAAQGATVTYTIVATNNGPSDVVDAPIADTVPAAITGVTWTCTATGTANCDTASGTGNAIALTADIAGAAGNNVTITVTGTATTVGTVTNTATITPPLGFTDTNLADNTSSQPTTITPAADLVITKTGTATAAQGEPVSYTITVTNLGPSNVTGAQIADTVPAAITGVTWACATAGTAACGTASGSGNAISLLGNINAGAGNSLTITVSGTATSVGSFTNTATVAPPAGTTDPVTGNNSASQPTTITPSADLAITKTGTATVAQGGAVTYSITVTNNGPSNVTGATIADTIPAAITGVSWSCAAAGTAVCGTPSGTGNISVLGDIAAGAGNSLTFTVAGTATTVGSFINTATVAPPAGTTDPTPANNTSSQPTTITPAADLQVVKTGPATVVQGSAISYSITVTNNGPSNVTGAQIADTVPGAITGVTWSCASAGTATCGTASGSGSAIGLLADIAAGAANSVTITVNGTPSTVGALTNTATVAPPAGTTDPTPANNTSAVNTTITPAADLAITKTGPATSVQGNVAMYTITVTNLGPSNVTGAAIVDTVPANLTGVAWTCASAGTAACGTASGTGNAISLLANINAGAGNSVTLTVTGTATTVGSFTNTATVAPPAGTTDPVAGNNSASQPTTITPSADLAIAKSGTASVSQGGTVTYSIVITNAGPSDVTAATIVDTVPANITAVSWSCASAGTATCGTASGAGNAISLTGDIAAGAGNSVTISVTGTATTVGSFINTATVAPPAGTTDPTPANNTSSQPTTIGPSADLAIAKTGTATAAQGQPVTYSIVVTNNGPSGVTGAQIADTVPAAITGVSWTCASAGTASCGTASGTGNTIGLLGDIAAGAGNSVTVSVTGTATTVGAVTNTATVAPPAGTNDPVTANNTSAVNTTITPSADLAITKTGTVTVAQGGAVSYTITVTNLGPSNVTGATIADTVPAGITGVTWSCAPNGSASCGTSVGSGNAISLTGDINVGAGNAVVITVNGTGTTVGLFTNTATVTAPAGTTDLTPANNSASQPTTITPAADLAITKTGTAAVDQNGAVTYTIVVTNSGPSAVTAAPITDNVPSNLTGVSWTCVSAGTAACSAPSGSGNAISLTADIAAGAGNSVTIAVSATATTPGSITNTATVATPAGTTDPTSGNNSASQPTLITPLADLAIVKTGPATVVQGQGVTYSIVATNNGPANVTGATLADTVPGQFTGVSWTCATAGTATCGSATGTGNAINLPVNIAPGAGNTVTLTVTATAATPTEPGSVTNTATIAPPAGTTDPTPGNDSSSVPTTIFGIPEITVTKTDALEVDADGSGTPSPGDTLRYTVTVTNSGNGQATGVSLADIIDGNLQFVAGSPVLTGGGTFGFTAGGGAPFGGSFSVTGATIATAGSLTLVYDTVVRNPLAAGVSRVANQTLASGSNFPTTASNDPETPTPGDPTITPLTASPRIALDKDWTLAVDADASGDASPGDTLQYTITVTNSGNQSGIGSVLNDVNDPNVTLVNGTVTATQGTITSGNATGNVVGVDLGEIPGGGGTAQVGYRVRIVNPLPAGVTSIANQASIFGTNFPNTPSNDPRTPPGGDPTVTPVVASPVLTAFKAASLVVDADADGQPSPGDTILYTVTLRNAGNQDAANTVYADTVDPNTAIVAGSVQASRGAVTTGNGGGVNIGVNVGTLPALQSATVTYRVTINSPVPAGTTQVVNQGTLGATGVPPVRTDDPATAGTGDPTVVTIVAAPRVLVTKDDSLAIDANGDGFVGLGDTIHYTLLIRNAGNATATDFVLADTPDPSTTLVVGSVAIGAPAGGAITSGNGAGDTTVGATFPAIAGGGEEVSVSFRVQVRSPLAEGITSVANQAVVSCTCPGSPISSDDPRTTTPGDPTVTPLRRPERPDISATKTVALTIDPDASRSISSGDTLEYTVVFRNTGTGIARAIAYSDSVDVNTTIVPNSITTTSGTVTLGQTGGRALAVNVGDVPAAGTVTIVYRVTVNKNLGANVKTLRNQGRFVGANVAGVSTDDPRTGPNGDPTAVDVVGATRLQIRKFGPVRAVRGTQTNYVVRITNIGSNPAAGLVVTDVLPAGLTPVGRPRLATVRGQRVTWRIPNLAVRRTIILTVRVRVTGPVGRRVTNTASVRATNAPVAVRGVARTVIVRSAVTPNPTG